MVVAAAVKRLRHRLGNAFDHRSGAENSANSPSKVHKHAIDSVMLSCWVFRMMATCEISDYLSEISRCYVEMIHRDKHLEQIALSPQQFSVVALWARAKWVKQHWHVSCQPWYCGM